MAANRNNGSLVRSNFEDASVGSLPLVRVTLKTLRRHQPNCIKSKGVPSLHFEEAGARPRNMTTARSPSTAQAIGRSFSRQEHHVNSLNH